MAAPRGSTPTDTMDSELPNPGSGSCQLSPWLPSHHLAHGTAPYIKAPVVRHAPCEDRRQPWRAVPAAVTARVGPSRATHPGGGARRGIVIPWLVRCHLVPSSSRAANHRYRTLSYVIPTTLRLSFHSSGKARLILCHVHSVAKQHDGDNQHMCTAYRNARIGMQ